MSCYLEGMKRLTLREQLRHVYWIAGGSAAGKSTIASRVARDHGLHVYATDDVISKVMGENVLPNIMKKYGTDVKMSVTFQTQAFDNLAYCTHLRRI